MMDVIIIPVALLATGRRFIYRLLCCGSCALPSVLLIKFLPRRYSNEASSLNGRRAVGKTCSRVFVKKLIFFFFFNVFARKISQSQCCGHSAVSYWQSISVCWWLWTLLVWLTASLGSLCRWCCCCYCEIHPSIDPSHSSVTTLNPDFEIWTGIWYFSLSVSSKCRWMHK